MQSGTKIGRTSDTTSASPFVLTDGAQILGHVATERRISLVSKLTSSDAFTTRGIPSVGKSNPRHDSSSPIPIMRYKTVPRQSVSLRGLLDRLTN
jgi:hypothetical protein